MTALDVKNIEQAGSDAVKKLRLEKLANGNPFMINSRDLPKRQGYLEYPDGLINLVMLSDNGFEFVVVRTLTKTERTTLRAELNLPEYA